MASTQTLGSSLLRELLSAVRAGTALAALSVVPGCSGHTPPSEPPGEAGAPGEGGSTGQPPISTGGTTSTPELTSLPADKLGCYGENHDSGFGYHGQCCFTQRCYTPESGKACASADAVYGSGLKLPPGSGQCGCGVQPDHQNIAGPFALNPSVPTDQEGTCCYVVGSIGCDGRPLITEGEAILASLALRSDWSSWS